MLLTGAGGGNTNGGVPDSCETQRGRSPAAPGRTRRRLLCCYRYRLAASPQRTLLPGQAGRLPERPGGTVGRRLSVAGRGTPSLPRPRELARAAGTGRGPDERGVEGAAAEAARGTPMKGRAAAPVGPGGPPAAGAAV